MNARASQVAAEALRGPRGAYISQSSIEVLRDVGGAMVSQAAIEVLRTSVGTRVSQVATEVLRNCQIGSYVSQIALEALRSNGLGARLSQVGIEALRKSPVAAHVSQASVEVLRSLAGSARITQLAIEVMRSKPDGVPETLVPWPFPANAGFDIAERYGYLSDVLRCQNGTEQRRLLRETAGGGISYTCTLLTARELQHAGALLASLIGQRMGVPLWQYAQRLSAGCAPGDKTIPADTSDVPFYAESAVMLWLDPWLWEVAWIEHVETGSLSLMTVLQGTWPAPATVLVPLVPGYLEDREEFARHSIAAGELALDFDVPAFFP